MPGLATRWISYGLGWSLASESSSVLLPAAVVTNGLISLYFKFVELPTSPAIFAPVLKPLPAAIHLDPNFPSIHVGPPSHKVMLYADDFLTFVSNPETSIPALLSTINSSLILKINWSKCEAFALTAYCPKTLFQPGNFRWSDQGIGYLGVLFPPNLSDKYRTLT